MYYIYSMNSSLWKALRTRLLSSIHHHVYIPVIIIYFNPVAAFDEIFPRFLLWFCYWVTDGIRRGLRQLARFLHPCLDRFLTLLGESDLGGHLCTGSWF